jgi:hypothetical protein
LAPVKVEADGFEDAARLPTEIMIDVLNTVQDGLEYLDWYGNLKNSLRLVDKAPLQPQPDYTEDGHLESEFEGRISGE